MSYNDPIDIESILQVPQTPPAATPAGVRSQVALPTANDPLPRSIAPPPTPIAVPATPRIIVGATPGPGPATLLPTFAPPLPSAKTATVQAIPQAPAATQTVKPLVPGPLISNTQTASQQQPTGTLTNISTLSQS